MFISGYQEHLELFLSLCSCQKLLDAMVPPIFVRFKICVHRNKATNKGQLSVQPSSASTWIVFSRYAKLQQRMNDIMLGALGIRMTQSFPMNDHQQQTAFALTAANQLQYLTYLRRKYSANNLFHIDLMASNTQQFI